MQKCVFLDRDGVLNKELGYQITNIQEFELMPDLKGSLNALKDKGFLLIIITNQSGIAKGSYDESFVYKCYEVIQKEVGGIIDAMYFAPGHESVSKSLMRKPDSLMFEKAIAKYHIDPTQSWMIGDKERDLIPAKKLGIKTVLVGGGTSDYADAIVNDLVEASHIINEVK
jgi:D-glycero-D-manno-heptose 1,7-bisphosphate phosphatase